jgi:hypothetical protein
VDVQKATELAEKIAVGMTEIQVARAKKLAQKMVEEDES